MHAAQRTHQHVPVEQWTEVDLYKAWLDSHPTAAEPAEYTLHVEDVDNLPIRQCVAALRNIDGLVVSCKQEGGQCRVMLHITSSTARYLYLRAVQHSQEANQVDRREIDGKH